VAVRSAACGGRPIVHLSCYLAYLSCICSATFIVALQMRSQSQILCVTAYTGGRRRTMGQKSWYMQGMRHGLPRLPSLCALAGAYADVLCWGLPSRPLGRPAAMLRMRWGRDAVPVPLCEDGATTVRRTAMAGVYGLLIDPIAIVVGEFLPALNIP